MAVSAEEAEAVVLAARKRIRHHATRGWMNRNESAPRPWLLVARAHGLWLIAALLVTMGAAIALALGSSFGLADRYVAVTPLVRLLPAIGGIAVGLSSGASAPDMERLGVRRLTIAINVLTLITVFGATALVAAGLLVRSALDGGSLPGPLLVTLACSVFAWAGIGLVYSATIGADYAWVGPGLLMVVVTLFGYDQQGRPLAWNFVSSPPSAQTVTLCFGLFATGMLSWNALRYRGARAVP